ncbi:Uncharacterized protein C24B11.05 [Vitis vinifera]|uniref:Uncharacterized protein C24B11.05 n=1 Tax=Vitis vinifera TaxID=29760 RepID=A0A438C577_VITVI|nr:Uncharacterized protein C24B11.05 [Vitis vinifera]
MPNSTTLCFRLSALSSSQIHVFFTASPMDFCGKSLRDSTSPFDCLVFDLDDTLYHSKTGIAEACKRNIEEFLIQKCGFGETKASSLRVELFKNYGSTLAGLRALGYNIDADDYHSFVHGRLPYELIKPDSQLRSLLRSIALRKIVLDRLGLQDCFDQIICFETMNPNLPKSTRLDEFPVILKPSLDAMKIALDAANVNPPRTLFLDDNVRNIAAGKALGLRTVLVGKTMKTKEADYVLETVHNLAQVIPEIWLGGKDGEDQRIKRTGSELDATLPTTPVGA